MLQSGHSLTCLVQGLHHPDSRPRAERINPRQPPPVFGLRLELSCRTCFTRQQLKRSGHLVGQPSALAFDPPLELVGFAEEEPIQEGSSVQRNRSRMVATLHGILEQSYVAVDDVRVEPQFG